MTVQIVFISDIHMSNSLPHAVATEDGTDRLADQVALWGRVHKYAAEKSARAIFVLGDLFDKSRVDAITLKATIRALAAAPCPVYLIAGNHDAVSTSGERFTVEAFGEMGNPRIHYWKTGERFAFPDAPWLGFWPLEYSTLERARARIAEMKTPDRREGTTEVLLMHQSVQGCTHGGWRCDDGLEPDEVLKQFDWCFSGHFHQPQNFGRENRGLYLGAPLHLRYDDVDRKAGFWSVRFKPDGSVKRVFVDGGCPRFFEIGWKEFEAGKRTALPVKGDYVRIVVTATAAEYEALRPAVDAAVAKLTAAGFKASKRHKPVYQHAVRIKPEAAGEAEISNVLTPERAAREYLKADGVELGSLDPKKLAQFATQALSAARAKTGEKAA